MAHLRRLMFFLAAILAVRQVNAQSTEPVLPPPPPQGNASTFVDSYQSLDSGVVPLQTVVREIRIKLPEGTIRARGEATMIAATAPGKLFPIQTIVPISMGYQVDRSGPVEPLFDQTGMVSKNLPERKLVSIIAEFIDPQESSHADNFNTAVESYAESRSLKVLYPEVAQSIPVSLVSSTESGEVVTLAQCSLITSSRKWKHVLRFAEVETDSLKGRFDHEIDLSLLPNVKCTLSSYDVIANIDSATTASLEVLSKVAGTVGEEAGFYTSQAGTSEGFSRMMQRFNSDVGIEILRKPDVMVDPAVLSMLLEKAFSTTSESVSIAEMEQSNKALTIMTDHGCFLKTTIGEVTSKADESISRLEKMTVDEFREFTSKSGSIDTGFGYLGVNVKFGGSLASAKEIEKRRQDFISDLKEARRSFTGNLKQVVGISASQLQTSVSQSGKDVTVGLGQFSVGWKPMAVRLSGQMFVDDQAWYDKELHALAKQHESNMEAQRQSHKKIEADLIAQTNAVIAERDAAIAKLAAIDAQRLAQQQEAERQRIAAEAAAAAAQERERNKPERRLGGLAER